MYGLTRATVTLIAAGVAGLLIWIATQIDDGKTGGYWAVYGLIAAAGLVMALSQLLGGWTKWGWPRVSPSVFLIAFIPVLIVAGWIVVYYQPHGNWFRDHFHSWTGDIHVRGFVKDVGEYLSVLAFGIGLVFGFSFDTTGPATEPVWRRRRGAVAGAGAARAEDQQAPERAEERRVEIREGGPPAEPPPRTGEPPPER